MHLFFAKFTQQNCIINERKINVQLYLNNTGMKYGNYVLLEQTNNFELYI